jgi:hypothetical protein
MSGTFDARETLILRALVNSAGVSRDALSETVPEGTLVAIDRLLDRGVVRKSLGGNYYVSKTAKADVFLALGIDDRSHALIEVLPDTRTRKEVAFFNGVLDPLIYQPFLADGISGCREDYESVARSMQVGDLLLNYLTAPYSEWICLLRVSQPPYRSADTLRGAHGLPWRVPGEFIVALPAGSGLSRTEASDATHKLGGKAAMYRVSPRRVSPLAARVIITGIMDVHRRCGSLIPVLSPGPEYGDLFG